MHRRPRGSRLGMSDAPWRKRERAAVIGRIVGWSLRSRGVVLVLGAAEVEPLITVPAQPRHRPAPVAVVVLGGLVTTTLLNLVVFPAST
jgi:hypothetical protein